MSIKLWIIIICSVIIYNIYYDTSLFTKLKIIKNITKLLVLIMGFGALTIINKSPKASYQNMKSIHDFIQVMPIEQSNILSPFFNHLSNIII